MPLKDITDAEKPWFDYTSYLLRIVAWLLAVAYTVHQQLRPQMPGTGPKIFEWATIGLATAFGIFLVARFMIMSRRMLKEIATQHFAEDSFRNRIIFGLMAFWGLFGTPIFIIGFAGEVIEQFVERTRASESASLSSRADDLPLSTTGPQYTVRPATSQPGLQQTARPAAKP